MFSVLVCVVSELFGYFLLSSKVGCLVCSAGVLSFQTIKLVLCTINSGATRVRKFGNLSIREILVVTSAYARLPFRPSVRPYRLWGRGRGVPRQPDGGRRMPSFLGKKSRGAFGQPAFFLAGNRMTIIVCEKDVSLKT